MKIFYAYLIIYGDGSTLLSGRMFTNPQDAYDLYLRERVDIRHRVFIVVHPKSSGFFYEVSQ